MQSCIECYAIPLHNSFKKSKTGENSNCTRANVSDFVSDLIQGIKLKHMNLEKQIGFQQ